MTLFNSLANDGNARLNADSIAMVIAGDQKQIELATYDHFVAVKAICNDKQKTKFDKIIGDVTKMMNGPHHGAPPRDGQGPPPPPPGGPDDRKGPPENE
jgi:hypothetical protein